MNNTDFTKRLVSLNAKVPAVEFATQQEEKPSALGRAARIAMVLGTGTALAGGAGWLRGRAALGAGRSASLGMRRTSMLGFRKIGRDVQGAVGAIKSHFAPSVATSAVPSVTPATPPGSPPAVNPPYEGKPFWKKPEEYSSIYRRLVRLNSKIPVVEFRRTEPHPIRQILIGAPLSSAIDAPKGKGWDAFGEQAGNVTKHSLKGLGAGVAIGTLAGAGAGAALRLHPNGKRIPMGRLLGHGALSGALVGGLTGEAIGTFRGHLGKDAKKIEKKYQRMSR